MNIRRESAILSALIKERSLKLGLQNPKGHPAVMGAEKFAEIVYFPIDTALLKAARARGCATVDGGNMAVGQAVGAFELFTGIKPDAGRMGAHLRAMLAAG